MHIQVITFQLRDMPVAEFQAFCDSVAQTFAELPSLISKTWLQDQETNTYGGVYLWQSRDALDGYLRSDLYNAVVTHPNFDAVTSREFGIVEGPTRVTRGMVGVAA